MSSKTTVLYHRRPALTNEPQQWFFAVIAYACMLTALYMYGRHLETMKAMVLLFYLVILVETAFLVGVWW
jgi:hypothetical protein